MKYIVSVDYDGEDGPHKTESVYTHQSLIMFLFNLLNNYAQINSMEIKRIKDEDES